MSQNRAHVTGDIPKARERIDVFVRTWCLLATCEMQPLCHVTYRATGGLCRARRRTPIEQTHTTIHTMRLYKPWSFFLWVYASAALIFLLFASAVPSLIFSAVADVPRPIAASSSISPWAAGYGQKDATALKEANQLASKGHARPEDENNSKNIVSLHAKSHTSFFKGYLRVKKNFKQTHFLANFPGSQGRIGCVFSKS